MVRFHVDQNKKTGDHLQGLICWCGASPPLPFTRSCLTCCMKAGQRGIHRWLIKKHWGTRTDRMWVVNRGKQGRAKDSATLSIPQIDRLLSSPSHSHKHIHTLLSPPGSTSYGPTHIPTSPCSLLSASSCLTPAWPVCVMNEPGDGWLFFFFQNFLSLCLTPYLMFTPFVIYSALPFPTSDPSSLLIEVIFFSTMRTVMNRKSL